MIYEAIDEYQIRRRLRALVTKVDGKLRIVIEDIGGIATCHISQSDCDRLADFLVDAGFGAAEDRPDVSGHDARDILTLSDVVNALSANFADSAASLDARLSALEAALKEIPHV